MNRRNLFRLAAVSVIGGFAAMFGVRPKKEKVLIEKILEWDNFFPTPPNIFPDHPLKLALHNPSDGPLQLWFNDKFFVDLPANYKDTVVMD